MFLLLECTVLIDVLRDDGDMMSPLMLHKYFSVLTFQSLLGRKRSNILRVPSAHGVERVSSKRDFSKLEDVLKLTSAFDLLSNKSPDHPPARETEPMNIPPSIFLPHC